MCLHTHLFTVDELRYSPHVLFKQRHQRLCGCNRSGGAIAHEQVTRPSDVPGGPNGMHQKSVLPPQSAATRPRRAISSCNEDREQPLALALPMGLFTPRVTQREHNLNKKIEKKIEMIHFS
jgi:hypothetical protein